MEMDDILKKDKINSNNEFQLTVSINQYDCDKSEQAIYLIELKSEITNKTWQLLKKWHDFYDLNDILCKDYLKIPYFPKSSFELSNKDKDLIKKILEKYVEELIKRPDLINSFTLKNFLELDNHFPDFNLFQPLKIYEIRNFVNPITTFYFSKLHNLLYVGLGNYSLASKITSFLGLSMSTNKEEDYLGGLSVYRFEKNKNGETEAILLDFIGYLSQVSCINEMEKDNIVCVGLADGSIFLYKNNKVDNLIEGGNEKNLLEEISFIKAHNNSVLNIGVQYSTGYIFSCAQEKGLVISEMNYHSIMKVFDLKSNPITCMVYDNELERIYISDNNGSIWIISVKSALPIVLHAIHNQLLNISCLEVNTEKHFIFAGNHTGKITFFYYDDFDSNEIIICKKLEFCSGTHSKISKLNYKSDKNELIISFANGSIGVYSHSEEFPEYILDAHIKDINSTFLDEENKILFTSGEDNTLKIWQFPVFWPSEMMRSNKLLNERSFISDNSLNNELKNAFISEKSKSHISNTTLKKPEDKPENEKQDEDYFKVNFIPRKKSQHNDYDNDEKENINLLEKENQIVNKQPMINKKKSFIESKDLNGWDCINYK